MYYINTYVKGICISSDKYGWKGGGGVKSLKIN